MAVHNPLAHDLGATEEEGPVPQHQQGEGVASSSPPRVLTGEPVFGESMDSEPLAKDGSVSSEALVGMSPDGSLAAAESNIQSRAGFSPVADHFLSGGVRATEQSGAPIGVADVAGQVSEAAATPQGEEVASSLGLPATSTALENDAGGESEALPDAEYALVLPQALVGMSPHGSLAAAESKVQSRAGFSPVADRFLSGGVRATEQGGAPIGVADVAGQVSGAAATSQRSDAPGAEEVASSFGLPVASTVLENDAGRESEALPDAEYALALPEPSEEAAIPHSAQTVGSADPPRAPERHGVGSSRLGSGTVQLQEEPADPLDGEAQPAVVLETDLLMGWPGAEPNGPVRHAAEEVPVAETWLPMGGGTVEVAARMARVISRLLVLVHENRAVLQLHPPELGRMSIRVTMAGGGVTVEMLVQDQAVKALVEARLDQLCEALAGQGLRTAALSVQVGQHAQQGVWSWLPRRGNRRARPSRSEPVRVGAAHPELANAILAGRDCTIDYWI